MKPWERQWDSPEETAASVPWSRQWQEAQPAVPAEEPSAFAKFGADLKRAGGRTMRYLAEGLPGLPLMVGDAANAGINTAFGTRLPPVSEAWSRQLTQLGLPVDETPAEKLAGAPSRVAAGIMGGAGLFGATAPTVAAANPFGYGPGGALGARDAIGAVRDSFTQGLNVQNQAAVGGSLAAESMRQNDFSPAAQMSAAIIGSTVAHGAIQGAKTAAGVVKPLTSREQLERVGGEVLRSQAYNEQQALDRLRNPANRVPGVMGTTGEAAQDVGLSAFEKLMRQKAPVDFSYRDAGNNAMRTNFINALDATQSRVDELKKIREQFTAPVREQALSSAIKPVDTHAIMAKVEEVAKNPEFAGAQTREAINWFKNQIKYYIDNGQTGAAYMYNGLQRDLNTLIEGKVESLNGRIRLSGGAANEIKKALSEEVAKVAPGFDKYLRRYAQMSHPIDRMELLHETLGDNLKNITNARPMVVNGAPIDNYALSQAKLRNIVMDDALMAQLNTKQRDTLKRVLQDLNAGVRNEQAIKTPGSDTLQNILQDRAIGTLMGERLAEAPMVKNTLGKVSKMAFKGADEELQRMLAAAMQDPKEARRLMELAGGFAPAARLLAPATTGGVYGLLGN